MTILVTGATGNVGRKVVELLLAAGAPVRATSRNPQTAELPAGVDLRAGDLDDPGSFGDALSGVKKLFLFPNPSGVAGFLDLARASGVQHVVLLSSAAVIEPQGTPNPIGLMHLSVEQAVEHSGIARTVLRPGSFASNALQWAPAIRESGEVHVPYAESTVSPIHERDIAAVAVQALLSDGHEGATYELTGPESMTQRRQVELIAAAIGRPVTVVDLAGDAARAQLEEQYGAFGVPGLVDSVLATYAASVGTAAPVTDTVARITGRAPAAFADWAVEHRPAAHPADLSRSQVGDVPSSAPARHVRVQRGGRRPSLLYVADGGLEDGDQVGVDPVALDLAESGAHTCHGLLHRLGPAPEHFAALENPAERCAVAAQAVVRLVTEGVRRYVATALDGFLHNASSSGREHPIVLSGAFLGPRGVGFDVLGVFGEEGEELGLELGRGLVHSDGDPHRASRYDLRE